MGLPEVNEENMDLAGMYDISFPPFHHRDFLYIVIGVTIPEFLLIDNSKLFVFLLFYRRGVT
jgi:hypothetical protein